MAKALLCCLVLAAVAALAAPARAGQQKEDCEARIDKLDKSSAEGAERLAEKYLVVDYCASQYKNDKTVDRLVQECAKYVEQPVIKQQFVAECMLAAYKYANTLYFLKAEYGK
jgi:hypothetical protein